MECTDGDCFSGFDRFSENRVSKILSNRITCYLWSCCQRRVIGCPRTSRTLKADDRGFAGTGGPEDPLCRIFFCQRIWKREFQRASPAGTKLSLRCCFLIFSERFRSHRDSILTPYDQVSATLG